MYAHFYKAAYHRFYIDEFYLFTTKRIIFNGVSRPIAWFAYITQRVSYAIRGLQSGQIQQYAFVFLVGTLLLVLLVVLI